jgi:hypothetical protein
VIGGRPFSGPPGQDVFSFLRLKLFKILLDKLGSFDTNYIIFRNAEIFKILIFSKKIAKGIEEYYELFYFSNLESFVKMTPPPAAPPLDPQLQ